MIGALPTRAAEGTESPSPLPYLIGQAFFSGFAMAALYATANTLFLVDYGSERLPYVYIVTALVVSPVSYGYAELQKRWTLSKLSFVTMFAFVVLFLAARFSLALPGVRWMSFALMVGFTLMVLMSAIVLGAQASRLFDVRQMKRLFPLVLSGQTLAIIASGLTVSLLVRLLGDTTDLLFVVSGSLLISVVFLVAAVRAFPEKLTRPQAERKRAGKSLPQLLRKRYVALVFVYQLLSSLGSQLIDYVTVNQADQTFDTPEAFASFFGNFMAAGTLLTLLFLLLLAGRLLNRFGLRFGLSINPGAVTLTVIAMLAVGVVLGPAASLFFWLAVSARIVDFVLSMGTTNTAVKATYQALPDDERITVQTAVDGIGSPIASGIAGASLLLFDAVPGLTLLHVLFYTIVVCGLWTAAGFIVYRNYANALLKTLGHRALNAADLTLEDGSSLVVIENLLQSPKIGEVCLALDVLEKAEHHSLDARLLALVEHPLPEIRIEALKRIRECGVQAALPVVDACLQSATSPAVQGAALRALCALRESDGVDQVSPYLDAPKPEVRLGAAVGLLRYGGIPGVLTAGERLTALARSADATERAFAAGVIGEVGVRNFYQPLLPLLQDEDFDVRQAGLIAASKVNHPRSLPLIIQNMTHRSLRSAAMLALVASGEALLPLVADALAGDALYQEEDVVRLVRACGQIKGARVIALLKSHIDHPDDDVQFQVLSALNLCGYRAETGDIAEIERVLKDEVKHGLRVLLSKQDIGKDEGLDPLHRALDHEFDQVRKRAFLLLSFIHNARAILRAAEQLTFASSREKALALETLDVTLPGEQKALVFPLADPKMTLDQRAQHLGDLFSLPRRERGDRLNEIITDPEGVWTQGWTRSCAIYAVAKIKLGDQVFLDAVEGALAITEHPVRETAAWALHTLAPGHYRPYAAELVADPNPQVAKLAAQFDCLESGESIMLLTIEKVAILKSTDIFAQTPDHILASVAVITEEIDLGTGETFIHQDAFGDDIYIIVEGQVRIHSGKDTVTTLGTGQVVGELAVLAPAPRLVSATTSTETRLLRIHKDAFDEVMADRPEIAQGIIQILIHRLRATMIKDRAESPR